MKFRILYCAFLFVILSQSNYADEGMWMPHQLKSREASMKERGLKIPVEDIYSELNPSLKDAVVLFGSGCTGEVISNEGLVLTNHHCGFSQIQSLSTLEHNYVQNGFWALDKSQELPCPGLTVTFIVKIINVTDRILAEPDLDPKDLQKFTASKILEVEKGAMKESWQKASVKSFYSGNEYYMFITETYRDIRFVGAPPASIGRFGGDDDNWMWPRHTGDFSLFRVYADSANLPAEYNVKNKPYTPKKSFAISLKGVHENDFTMVFGFPGKTIEYIPSFAVDLVQNINDPTKVNIRDRKLSIWRERMNSNDTIKLKYVSKYGTIANYWKKWSGEMQGLRRKNVIAEKQIFEQSYTDWVGKDNRRRDQYAGLLHEMELFYTDIKPVSRLYDYYNEAVLGVELLSIMNVNVKQLATALNDTLRDDTLKIMAGKFLKGVPGYFKNYDAKTDELVLASVLKLYHDSVEERLQPAFYKSINGKYKGDYSKYAEMVFRKSVFTNEQRLTEFLTAFSHKSAKKLFKDPAYIIYKSFTDIVAKEGSERMTNFNDRIASLQSRYMKAQMEMYAPEILYPDANLTLRISYGQVQGYNPRDGIHYNYQSFLKGIIEKYIPGDPDFDVPKKLISLYNAKDFGNYSQNGDVPVTFIASNHTTGGNSGSPVINENGELIGTNFDRVWEGTLSDIEFDPSVCRNIVLDIRYTLFIIEKFGSASNIIRELQIVK
jgi:hypothetical protein